ncbi:hypothetical protein J056_002869 [Wallemia ichthyophaga EXF-994]|uniref:Zn(2)-C6 fungal-type domain-containing protein n=1 Tax=Wallemia ichthyophaga (strain EXF-994 / CBS 113033) TaxID=1299270 RepID=R9A9Q5_WALI9|nr:uncharacterized protein J056_002869 [Wallemia ichthyophaga EXF-994]EOQ98759.1 hypothetical protein J056_002869 [Wallemia ichthyophaga EXF-994]TIB28279.1 hypothetical protein E3P84_04115 [Wallemia ichthyophaga]TIB38135.1 hypothetical protein E3P83_04116 [Wallemia ichthyophaga]
MKDAKEKPAKSRKQRPLYSCGECRRLKLKCDRQWPCNQCRRRGCSAICPDGTMKGATMSRQALVDNTSNLLSRIDQLESSIRSQGGIVPHPATELICNATAVFNSPNSSAYPTTTHNGFETHQEDFAESFGALTVSREGQSRYVGPSAGSEWLQNESLEDTEQEIIDEKRQIGESSDSPPSDFPFSASNSGEIVTELWKQLPSREIAGELTEIYYRTCSCLYNCVQRDVFEKDLDILYVYVHPDPHKLARLYMVFALGVYFDTTRSTDHPDSQRFYSYSKSLLSAGDFLVKSSIPAAQTLHMMGLYLLNRNRLSGADSYYPLLGVQLRIARAMGLHRDGARWGFTQAELNERRMTFWETQTMDVFQSICFGRPYSTQLRHVDCKFPRDEHPDAQNAGFQTLRYTLVRLLCKISDDIYSVKPPTYDVVIALDREVRQYDKDIPPHLRCNAAAVVRNSSNYPLKREAVDGEELILQQHTLAMNVNECLLYINRRYFAHALKTHPQNPLKSPFAQSFIAVMECCRVMVALGQSIHRLLPDLSARHFFFFYHMFSFGVCSAASCIISPGSSMASDAWMDLNSITDLCALPSAGKRANQFVPALNKLRERALVRCKEHIEAKVHNTDDHDNEHMVMLGLGSRVVTTETQTTRFKTPTSGGVLDGLFENDKGPNPSDQIYSQLLKQTEGTPSSAEMFNNLWNIPNDTNSALSLSGSTNEYNNIFPSSLDFMEMDSVLNGTQSDTDWTAVLRSMGL